MRIPNKLPIEANISGTALKRTINSMIDAIKANTLSGDQKTILVSHTPSGSTVHAIRQENTLGGGGGSGGSGIFFGKVTAVTDANNYTVSVYVESDLSDTPTTGKSCYVMSIVDSLAVDDVIPIKSTAISGKDYESAQQLGAVG